MINSHFWIIIKYFYDHIVYVMTRHFVNFKIIFEMSLSLSHFQMIFWTCTWLCYQSWMLYGWKIAMKKYDILHVPHHHLLVECTTNTWLQLFHVEFEVTSYDYNQLYSHLGHLMIDFLVIKDIILSNEWKTM